MGDLFWDKVDLADYRAPLVGSLFVFASFDFDNFLQTFCVEFARVYFLICGRWRITLDLKLKEHSHAILVHFKNKKYVLTLMNAHK